MQNISQLRTGKRQRCSSYDRSGGNKDFFVIEPGGTMEIANIKGAGRITHIWMTYGPSFDISEEMFMPRKLILRVYWDNEQTPSIEAPLGDFFGLGHGITKNYSSVYLSMSPENGRSFNCFFPMPFENGARFEIVNESSSLLNFYFYIDYEQLLDLPDDELRFHARWYRECVTDGIQDKGMTNEAYEFCGKNLTGEGNYTILEATGNGHYVGCNLNIHNLRHTNKWNWYGEGDDMIFIDGEPWPPRLHGTGTEDYFNTAWCPQQEFCTPYHGIIMGGGPNWSGKISLYRYHILDPVILKRASA